MKGIKNVKVITDKEVLRDYSVIYDERIIDIVEDIKLKDYELNELIDGEGGYLSPGFIDSHVHGEEGKDAMDSDEGAVESISVSVLKTGVTAYLPTTMTMDMKVIEKALDNIRNSMKKNKGARVLGCHLEGPFISTRYKGAQSDEYIIRPEISLIEKNKDIIKIVTLAVEEASNDEFIKRCREYGIIVSIGHSNAKYDEAMRAISLGANHITHTFNAMTPLHHREPGVVGAAMNSDVFCELIADNIHVHPAVQQILLKVKGTDRIILITDAMRACMLNEGKYDLGGQEVIVKDDQARLSDGTLAGSVLTINKAVKNFCKNTKLPLNEVIKMASLNPARLLNIDNDFGSIEKGKYADMVMMDDKFDVIKTIVNGEERYRR